MGRLISLRLSSSDIKTVMVPSPTTQSTLSPIEKEHMSPRCRPAPVTELLIFPTTQQEYNIVMEEITTLYQKRQYRQCSARCIQILDNIKDPYRVHPLYSIYISFYAASSLELTARALHINSSSKLPTFQQALFHYQHAESFMDYATFSADPSLVKAARQRSSSVSSSIRSSVDSIFSTASSATSSPLPSPTSSIYGSLDMESSLTHTRNLSTVSQLEMKPAPLKVQKRVSFSSTVQFLDDAEEDAGKLSFRDSLLLEAFPLPPTSPLVKQQTTEASSDTIQTYLLDRSLTRYITHLTSMHTQLHHHIASTTAQIHALTLSKKARRSNLPNLFDASTLPYSSETAAQEAKQVELKARIERLKSEGWRRERFNPERYQRLCGEVLGDMGEMF